MATPLSLTDKGSDTIPNERIFISSANTKTTVTKGRSGFEKMNKSVILGSGNQTLQLILTV